MSGLVGKLGQGIGIAMEYKEHRKQQKALRERSQEEQERKEEGASREESPAGPSSRAPLTTQGPPTNYSDEEEREIASSRSAVSERRAKSKSRDDMYDEDEDSYSDEIETDQADWQLDEVFQASDDPPSYEEARRSGRAASPARSNNSDLVHDILETAIAQPPNPAFLRRPLPCPVILPQRRPGTKQRGFVRAYAPLLGECAGISQEKFLAFLKNFHKASQASPVFAVISVSAAIAGLVPSVTAMVVSTLVQAGAQAGRELDARRRTNHFLDQVNRDLFMPAGLYALIMKYKPDAAGPASASSSSSASSRLEGFGISLNTVDLDAKQVIAKRVGGGGGEGEASGKSWMQQFRLAGSTTRGSAAMPEAAPLIFPAVDDAIATAAAAGGEETFKDKTRDAKKFLANYIDRRKQMQYAQNHPDDALAMPLSLEQSEPRSKFADPSHPMYNSGLLGLVTGGALSGGRGSRGGGRSWSRDGRRGGGGPVHGLISAVANRDPSGYTEDAGTDPYDRDPEYGARRAGRRDMGDSVAAGWGQNRKSGRGGSGLSVKRLLKEDVLYLTIVNMPSEAELLEARRAMNID